MMDGITSEECDGYKCYNCDDANSEIIWKIIYDSMSEGRNEEGNGE